VVEVMRDLGIEPEPGEVLMSIDGQPGAMLSYAEVKKMMIYNVHRWYTDGRKQFPQPTLILPPWALAGFDQAFHRRDPGRSGFIDSEEVKEVMRDLGIEPEPGEVLMSFGCHGAAMLSYTEVLKMMTHNVHWWYTASPSGRRAAHQALGA